MYKRQELVKTAKTLAKKKKPRKVSAASRKPSGFAKPSLISDELCEFLGKERGTQMARTEVTKFLTGYIKEHDLQDPTNRRHILPDDALKSLLKVDDKDEVTYFNLQKFMKGHYHKAGESTGTTSASTSA